MTTPTREQVVQWAREAGLQLSINAEAYPSIARQLINFATLARADLEATIAERNKVKASYNHAEHMAERREMMQAWADWI